MLAYQGVSIKNSTATPLAANATFTGQWEDVASFNSVVIACRASAVGTLYLDFSTDAINTDSALAFSIAADVNEVHRLVVVRRWARTRFVNGSVAQTFCRVQTLMGSQTALTAPLNLTIQSDADASVVRTVDSELLIAGGLLGSYSIINKFGRNPSISTATVPEDIWAVGGVYTGFPTGAAELVQLASSSVNDTAAGTGARTVRIYGLNATGVEQEETITLAGTTQVDSVNTYTRVNRLSVLTSGNSNQAFNAGDVTCRHKVTTANVFGSIPVGYGQGTIAAFTIPFGKTGYVRRITIDVYKTTAAVLECALWVRESGASPRLIRPTSVSDTTKHVDVIYGGLPLVALTDITIRVVSSSANNIVVLANFDIVLVTT